MRGGGGGRGQRKNCSGRGNTWCVSVCVGVCVRPSSVDTSHPSIFLLNNNGTFLGEESRRARSPVQETLIYEDLNRVN